MITFSNLEAVLEILKPLAICNSKEIYTAVNCLKIIQVNAKTTRFITYEPKVGYYQRDLVEVDSNTFGIEDTTYIVDFETFYNLLFQNKGLLESSQRALGKIHTSVSLREEEGMLAVYFNLRKSLNQTEEYTSSNQIPFYLGDLEDFQGELPPITESILLGTVNSEDLSESFKTTSQAGDYSGALETYSSILDSQGRTVRLEFNHNTFKIFGDTKNRDLWFEVSKAADFEDKYIHNIEGRALSRLQNLAYNNSDIEISTVKFEDNDEVWLQFKAADSLVTIRTIEDDTLSDNNYKLFLKNRSDYIYSKRVVNLFELVKAFKSKQDTKAKCQQQLLLVEQEEEDVPIRFSIIDSEAILSNRDSRLDILEYDDTSFAPIAFRYSQIESIEKILTGYYSAHRQAEDNLPPVISLQVCLFDVHYPGGSSERALMYIEFEYTDGFLCHLSPTSLVELGIINNAKEETT